MTPLSTPSATIAPATATPQASDVQKVGARTRSLKSGLDTSSGFWSWLNNVPVLIGIGIVGLLLALFGWLETRRIQRRTYSYDIITGQQSAIRRTDRVEEIRQMSASRPRTFAD
jgi:hypothetical protein